MAISDLCSIDITLHSMYEALILFVKFMPASLKRLAMITAGQEDLLIIFRRQENYTYLKSLLKFRNHEERVLS